LFQFCENLGELLVSSIYHPINRTALIKIIATPTKIPSCLLGNQETSFAAIGAIKIPPSANPPTTAQSISRRAIFAKKA
jgi:hypothetical protein